MDYERMYYRSSDGSLILDFVFMYCGPEIGWRAYIITEINYGRFADTSGHASHRNRFEGDTYPCICWSDRVDTLSEMKAIAALWSDVTAIYMETGETFDSIAKSLSKK
jgi:hypothetical protein